MYCAIIERSSCMESMPVPKKAVEKARKRQELSSGIIRRIRVDECVRSGSSGASMFCEVGLRLRERGLEGFGAGVEGAVPTPAKEKADVVVEVPLAREALLPGSGGFRPTSTEGICLFGPIVVALTIICSPSSLIPISDNGVAAS